MTTPDLLKLCDDALAHAAESSRLLKVSSIGSSQAGRDFMLAQNRIGEIDCIRHTREPILASALKKLVPYANHRASCSSYEFSGTPEEPKWIPCDCGFDSALSEIEGKVSGG